MTETQPRTSSPVPFVLPLIVYLIITSFYPQFAESYVDEFDELDAGIVTPETWKYLLMVGVQVVLASAIVLYFRKVYLEHFPFRVSPISVGVGVVGVVLWIGVCSLEIEPRLLGLLGFDFSRPSFNPNTIEDSGVRMLFLGLRFSLLVMVGPIVEELFLRGWLVRWVENPAFETVSLKGLSVGALLAASGYGVLTHPTEAIAAFLWFGLVTWLMNRTGSLWDCIVAHSVTNLLLGIYVLQTGAWHLW